MIIAIDALAARTGGGRTYLRNVLRYEANEGVEVLVLAPPTLELPELGPGIRRVRIEERWSHPALRGAWERIRLPALLKDLNASVLFCANGTASRFEFTIPTVAMCRNMLPFDPVQRRRFGIGYTGLRLSVLRRRLLRGMVRADLVIFVSEYAREFVSALVDHFPATAVIPHGVGHMFRQAGTNPGSPAGDDPYLLYVSDLLPYKNQVQVVAAFARIRRQHPERLQLVLAGRPTSSAYARRVHEEVARHGLVGSVMFLGHVDYDALPSLYAGSSVTIFASECENCPNVLLESLASGRPLVASDRRPMPEFAGEAALYADPARPDELADRVLEILSNPVLGRTLGERAASRSLRFDWATTARSTWSAIAKLGRSDGDGRLAG